MESEALSDLYQASYYLMSGCQIVSVDCIPTGKALSCHIVMQGPNLQSLSQAWFEKTAMVNLWAFRNAYSKINSHVHMAKRSFDQTNRLAGGQS